MEERLLPLRRVGRKSRHDVIVCGVSAAPSSLFQGRGDTAEHGFVLDGDLDIDHILRWQARHGCGTYVIDPLGVVPEGIAEFALDLDELVRPSLARFPDDDPAHRVIRSRRR
jgi:hypothetical protein